MDQVKIAEAIVAGIFLIAVAMITAFFTSRNNKKNIFINTVTGERAKWRDELRRDTAEFCKLAYEEAQKRDGANKPRLRELKALIRLRLNPNPEHKLDKAIRDATEEAIVALDAADKSNQTPDIEAIESNVQALLKQEWEKSKEEAHKGKLVKKT